MAAIVDKDKEELLPESFQPSKFDVIVGWARQNYHHEGNQMLREIVRENVHRYNGAKTKHEKGEIIVEILEKIKAQSPSGLGLLRQSTETKRWFYIGTDKAKDKIGHALRKASKDLSSGVKGSPIRQKKHQMRRENDTSAPRVPSRLESPPLSLAPHRSAFSAGSGMALKSFKTGPGVNSTTHGSRLGLESWPLRSVTSLSSSESHSEESLLQSHPVQITVPSSPVTRPTSAASNQTVESGPFPHHGYDNAPPPHHQRHHVPLETHYEDERSLVGGYYGSGISHYHYEPQQYMKGEYDYRRNHHHRYPSYGRDQHFHYSNPNGGLHDRVSSFQDYPIYPSSQDNYQYRAPPSLDGSYHRVFDEVEQRMQQEEQQRGSYHGQDVRQDQHQYYHSTGASFHEEVHAARQT